MDGFQNNMAHLLYLINRFWHKKNISSILIPFVIVTLFCQISNLLSSPEMRRKIQSLSWNRTYGLNSSEHYTCVSRGGRMGNHMFQYAAIYALSRRYNLTVLLQKDTDIVKFFKVPSAKLVTNTAICRTFERRIEKKCCAFDENLTLLAKNRNFAIEGYLQSWRYFENHYEEVKRELTFISEIRESSRFIVNNLRRTWSIQASRDGKVNVTTVGVHIRQGDMVTFSKMPAGFDVAPEGYIQRAVDYFLSRFQQILFIVCSDNIPYSKKIFTYRNVSVEYVELSPIQDMAVISSCDHVLMTVGTFGWWAGFLSGGIVVYYKYPIREGSQGRQNYNYNDFSPPSWIGLG